MRRVIETLTEGPEASVIESLIERLADRAERKASPAQAPKATLAGVGQGEDTFPFLAPAQAADEIGRLGGYRVLKELGRGGMGIVFQAEDPKLKRLVALKVMLPVVAADAAARQRFLREAQAMAAVHHDHVVTIHARSMRTAASRSWRWSSSTAMPLEQLAEGRTPADRPAGAAHRPGDRRGAGGRPRARPDPPRHQARQHLAGLVAQRHGSKSSISAWPAPAARTCI